MPTTSDSNEFDIVVLGGGVAGAAAAIQQARANRRVVVVTAPRTVSVYEGMSPRTADGLRFAGCDRALAAAGPWVDRYAHWNGVSNQANGETLVDRAAFDAGLLDDLRAAGVDLRVGRVDSVSRAPDGWHVVGPDGDGAVISARFLVEARGRQAPARGGRRHGPASTALVRRWHVPEGAPATSAVASFVHGWCWFAHPGRSQADMQIVVAGEGLPAKLELDPFYMERLAEIDEAADWLRGGVPFGPVTARNANVFVCDDLVGMQSIRIGDAAHGLDPLSGHGQFQAVSTALNAVAVINTLLDRPDDGDLARRFYAERIEHAFLMQSRVGRDFYRLESRWTDRPFWTERAAWPDDVAAHPQPETTPPVVAHRPVVEDGYVVEREVVVTADHPRGIWQIDGVPLVSLMHFLDREWRPGGNLTIEAADRLSCQPKQIETALSWLSHRGLLVTRDV